MQVICDWQEESEPSPAFKKLMAMLLRGDKEIADDHKHKRDSTRPNPQA
jgi:hypothetical protein